MAGHKNRNKPKKMWEDHIKVSISDLSMFLWFTGTDYGFGIFINITSYRSSVDGAGCSPRACRAVRLMSIIKEFFVTAEPPCCLQHGRSLPY